MMPPTLARQDLPPDIYEALYGPNAGWERVPGSREHRERQLFYPNLPINGPAWDAAVASWPMSSNIEDRRGEVASAPQPTAGAEPLYQSPPASGPWAKYQQGATSKPWEKYGGGGAPEPAKREPGILTEALGAAGPVGQVAKAFIERTSVGKRALQNAPASAVQFAKDVVQPIIHPVDTAIALKNLGMGVLEKMGSATGLTSRGEHEQYAEAVGKFFADRYGSVDKAMETLATDPVGMAADAATLLSGIGLAGRLPGAAGQVARVAGQAGRAIDPLTPVAAAARGAGHAIAPVIGGLTGTEGETIREAARAGAEGGARARAFQENLRDQAPMEQAVQEARGALAAMRHERGAVYRQQMANLYPQGFLPLDFTRVNAAIHNALNVGTFRGVNINPPARAVRNEILDTVTMWQALDPTQYHTVEGFDALKRAIGNIRSGTDAGTPARRVADTVYHAVRQSIVMQAPEYAPIMRGYEEATRRLREIERTLSLNENATIDTSLRKLQSALRDNVNTSYGRRRELAQFLIDNGATHLIARLAGQALKPVVPRGLARLGAQVGLELVAAGAGFGVAGGPGLAAAAVPLLASSPRLMGEAAFGLGRVSPYGVPAGRGAFQAGRLERTSEGYPFIQSQRSYDALNKPNLYRSTE